MHINWNSLDVRDNALHIGGVHCQQLLERNNGNPVYAYDAQLLIKHIRELRSEIDSRISIHYAIKANPNADILRTIVPEVQGLDVASALELQRALESGCPASDISMAGPGKSDDDLRESLTAGITINIESAYELERISEIHRTIGGPNKPRVAVRVNPGFELKNSGMKMTGGSKPFGIDAEKIPALLEQGIWNEIEFQGFHIFCGSQNLKPEAICSAQLQSYELALELTKYAPQPPNLLNLGGGFGVPYFPGDRPLEITEIAQNLHRLADRASNELPGCELVLELGRYLVARSGFYLCKVVDIKESRGHTFVVTNGGMHHHLAASGNFGQVIRKNYPVVVGNRIEGEVKNVSVVGPLCTPLDLLADKMDLPEIKIGDVIVILQSGAYGYTASPQLFLSHPAPSEMLL